MSSRTKNVIAALLGCAAIVGGYAMFGSKHTGLAAVHERIERQFTKVRHLDGDALSAMAGKDVVLFDVREVPEFAVSHLKDAIRVDPAISDEDFATKFGEMSKGKIAIFYCSVGQRSSSLADRAQRALLSSGTKAAYNLEGGIFKWHNEHRPLFSNAATPTTYVHPYNAVWGRMVKDQKNIRYSTPAG